MNYPNLQNSSNTVKRQEVENSSDYQKVNPEKSSMHLSSDVFIHAFGDRSNNAKERSQDRLRQSNKDYTSETNTLIDAEILMNFNIEAAVKNLRRFYYLVRKLIKLMERAESEMKETITLIQTVKETTMQEAG